MNRATRDRIARKAKLTVKARHKEPKPKPEPSPAIASVAAHRGTSVEQVIAGGELGGAMPEMPKLPSARARKAKATNPCACGCGTPTGKLWAPGHDARAKGWAIRIERQICKLADVPEREQAGAKLVLNQRKSEPRADIKLVKEA